MGNVNLHSNTIYMNGKWRTYDDINIWNVDKKVIYRPETEPGFVCWTILWKEADGCLKLSFTEVEGDIASWPPGYNFNDMKTTYYLKTLMSTDNGVTWKDTGWKEKLDDKWELNSDHHIRHVIQLQDDSLLRNYCHTAEGFTGRRGLHTYDEKRVMENFPFSEENSAERHAKAFSVWKSNNGGNTWENIYYYNKIPAFFATGFHLLSNGSIVATGAIINSFDFKDSEGYSHVITESWDGGYSWSDPCIVTRNEDRLVSERMCEESDFVELSDGRLFLIIRTAGQGTNFYKIYLSRTGPGRWEATSPATDPALIPSGYPFLYRAKDGTLFYYDHTNIRYSCDDGKTWASTKLGYSYYGQLTETAPGKILTVTQKNIFDSCYPWNEDAYLLQTMFEFERTGVLAQVDGTAPEAIAVLGESCPDDFHLCADIRADGETGIAFHVNENGYSFAAVVIPNNEFRGPGRAEGKGQTGLLIVGKFTAGNIKILRKIRINEINPGEWVKIQVDMASGLLKAAVLVSDGQPAKYAVVRDDFGENGKIGLFTNKSTGAFKNVRLIPESRQIRSGWDKWKYIKKAAVKSKGSKTYAYN